MAVTVLVSPGPAVTAATPTVPDMRATASAAKAAAAWKGVEHALKRLLHMN